MDIILVLIVVIPIAVLVAILNHLDHLDKKRREALLAKYGNAEIVEMIMKEIFWQGQTPEQLVDSIGNPVDVDKKVMKTKTREVWKYNAKGKGRFSLRITLEDGVVVGWDKKS